MNGIITKPYYDFFFQSREQASPFSKDMISQVIEFEKSKNKNEKLIIFCHHHSQMLHCIKLFTDKNLIKKYPYAFSSVFNEQIFDEVMFHYSNVNEETCRKFIYEILTDLIYKMLNYLFEVKEHKLNYNGENPEDITLLINAFKVVSNNLDFRINGKNTQELLEYSNDRAFFFHYTRLSENAAALSLEELMKSLSICYKKKSIPENAIPYIKQAQIELNNSIDELINN